MQYFYVDKASRQVGPISVDQLQSAGITKDTLVWKEGMKEWMPAGTIEELKQLFPAAPPPPPVPASPPPVQKKAGPPPVPENKVSPKPANKTLLKIVLPVAGAVLLILVVTFLVIRHGKENNTIAQTLNTDSLEVSSDTRKEEDKKVDTVKIIDLDTMANKLKWDTTAVLVDSSATGTKNVSFLPGFGNEQQSTNPKTNKKPGNRKQAQKRNEEVSNTDPETEVATVKTEPERVNPASFLTVKGSFRKNLFFEAILEGTVHNRANAQIRDIVIEVRFLDASGQSLGSKKFMQNGPVAAGAESSFKFKATAPKGTKNVRYDIEGARF